jgi:hypothetical protein
MVHGCFGGHPLAFHPARRQRDARFQALPYRRSRWCGTAAHNFTDRAREMLTPASLN